MNARPLVAAVSVLALCAGAFGAGWFGHARRARLAAGAAASAPGVTDTLARRTTEEDTDHDGRPDRWVTRDSAGTTLFVALDRNRDGRRDKLEHYGGDHRVQRADYDDDYDGYYERYDAVTREGYAIMTYYDRDWDDTPNRWVQRGAHGEVVSEWVDDNEDGAPERYREFDAQGRKTQEGRDDNGDGLYEEQRIFNPRWNDDSRAQSIEYDANADGLFERRDVFDRAGVLLSRQTDTDNDGLRDTNRTFVDGVTIRREGHDRDGDGDYEEWQYPGEGGNRVGHDDDHDHELDRWDPPGPPAGWCAARCRVSTGPLPSAAPSAAPTGAPRARRSDGAGALLPPRVF